jgi:hypothetical protein
MSRAHRVILFIAILLIVAGTGSWAQSAKTSGSATAAKDPPSAAESAVAEAAAASAAAAKAAAKSIPDLRVIADAEFNFVLFRDPLLYPETSIELNPAVAAGYASTLVSGELDLPYERSDESLIRADDSTGQKGGMSRKVDDALTPDFSIMSLFPAKMGKTSVVAGVFGTALLALDNVQTQNTNYNSISESEVITDLTWPLGLSVGGLLAGGKRASGWGLTLEYAFTMDLHSFERIDSVAAGTTSSRWTDALNDSDIFTHDLDFRLGKRFPLSRSTTLGLAAQLGAGLRDASTSYISVDSDDDGTGDTVMSLHDYYFSADYQTTAAYSYDRSDRTWGFRALLSPDIRVSLQDGVEVFIAGTWRGLDMDYRTYHEHVLYDASSTDESRETSILNSGLRSGELLLGVALGTNTDSLWKIGAGYRRIDEQFSENGWDSVGSSIYSTVNPNHYPEVSLSLTPKDDLVSEMVDALGLPPWSDVTNAIFASLSFETKASVKLRLFASLRSEWFNQVQTWEVFNLDTRTVWSETVTVNEFSWDAKAIAGLAFELDKNAVFVLDCVGTGVSGIFTGSSETLPFDTTAGTETTNGSTDLTKSSPLTLKIHAGLTFRY